MIKHYAKREHASGFEGFRVSVTSDGASRDFYFSTRGLDPHGKLYQIQRLKAELCHLEFKEKQLYKDYLRFISQDAPSTKPYRGTGRHGLTCEFRRLKSDTYVPGFSVRALRQIWFHSISASSYTEAWESAVVQWSEVHDIPPDHARIVLQALPDPEQFKNLRRQMIIEGKTISPAALQPILQEQRRHLTVHTPSTAEPPRRSRFSIESFAEGLLKEISFFRKRRRG